MAALGTEAALELKQALIKDSLEAKIADNVVRIHSLVHKSLSAGYGGAGSPTSLTGGGVFQSESLEPRLKFITCDNCGKEQVYGKFQVKCRDCGKAFSMAKLEKFFKANKE
jgi:hypothetical protein